MTIDFSRYGVMPGPAEQSVGFFLPHTFGMLPFISALEPLRAANRYSGKPLYSWQLLGEKREPVFANNGMQQQVECTLEEASSLDYLVICGPHEPHHYNDQNVFKILKKQAASGTRMVGLDTGSYLLARARVIEDHRCTIHWENLPGFREEFPHLQVSTELFEVDRNLYTCAGGGAALDMMLTIIKADHGHELASQAAELFIHSNIRRANEPQRMGTTLRTGIFHPGLIDCVELMEANIEQPLSTQELADMINISKRQLERLFRAHLKTTPTTHYQQIRLQAGMRLLEQTSLTILDVAIACGFASAGHFSKRFRAYFGHSPRQSRTRPNGP